jgi:hypothetical protein
MHKAFPACVEAHAGKEHTYCATTAVPANWHLETPAIEYSSARKETLTVLVPVGAR